MLLSIKEFASRTGETVYTIRHWCQRGQIPATFEMVPLKNPSLFRREWRLDDALLVEWQRPVKRRRQYSLSSHARGIVTATLKTALGELSPAELREKAAARAATKPLPK